MRSFLLQLLVFSAFIFTAGCSTRKADQSPDAQTTVREVQNAYFSDSSQEYFYRADIEVYGNTLSGVLIIKKTAENHHRIVITGDFGNKMFDAEISGNQFKINYIVPKLNRSVVKKVLEKDFKILVREHYAAKLTSQDENRLVYDSKNNREGYRLFYEMGTGLLSQIIVTENGRAQSIFKFEAKYPIFADRIEIVHQDIQLKINLHSIEAILM